MNVYICQYLFLTGPVNELKKNTLERMINEAETRDLRYSLLLESEDYISILDSAGIRKFANKAYCAFLNKEAEELVGVDVTLGLTAGLAAEYKRNIAGLSRENPTITHLIQVRGHGKVDWISWKATGIFDKNGDLQEILAIGRCINDLINAREEKAQILNTLNAFKKAIDNNIICSITDEKGIITYANKNFCKISKYSRVEVEGHTHSIINSGYHPPEFFGNMWATIKSGKMWTADIKNKAKDGTFYWVNSVIIPIRDHKKKISGYLSLRIHIDEKIRLEEERKSHQKSLENMLFMVSHEIRKPITNSQGLLHLMKEGFPGTNEEYFEFVSYLMDTTEELNNYSYKLNDYIDHNIRTVYGSYCQPVKVVQKY